MPSSSPVARVPRGDLSRDRLVLSIGGARRGRLGWIFGAVLVAALGAGAGLLYGQIYGPVHGMVHGPVHGPEQLAALRDQSAGSGELAPLRQALDQARLQLRVAAAHGHELERQVDTLNQRLRESQEELTFFRKTRDPRR